MGMLNLLEEEHKIREVPIWKKRDKLVKIIKVTLTGSKASVNMTGNTGRIMLQLTAYADDMDIIAGSTNEL